MEYCFSRVTGVKQVLLVSQQKCCSWQNTAWLNVMIRLNSTGCLYRSQCVELLDHPQHCFCVDSDAPRLGCPYVLHIARAAPARGVNKTGGVCVVWLQTERAAYLLRQFLFSDLHNRVLTRPFLALPEKRWLTMQLLHAAAQAPTLNPKPSSPQP